MRVKELRVLKNLTQDELAKKMDVTRSTVAMWETGKALPNSDKLPKLAEVLGCTIDELYGNINGNTNSIVILLATPNISTLLMYMNFSLKFQNKITNNIYKTATAALLQLVNHPHNPVLNLNH